MKPSPPLLFPLKREKVRLCTLPKSNVRKIRKQKGKTGRHLMSRCCEHRRGNFLQIKKEGAEERLIYS
jgi:hypothetical protein